ncbi:probable G-protein coupled receptor No18 isoform X2 [Homarus americanus]|nr:probable G-protein coupled receptor No18 isoform X2 [Homarus americanus]
MVAVGGAEGVAAWVTAVAITLVLVIVFLVSSVLNTIFLVIFFRRSSLRSISNRFIVSLTVCNLLASWLLLPLVIADTFLPNWESASLCRAIDAVSELVASASVFATLLIAVDRFCAITDPLHYHMLVTRPKSVAMIASGWIAAALIAAAAGLGDMSNRAWNVCGAATAATEALTETTPEFWSYRSYFVVINMAVSFMVPMILLIWIYIRIYHAAHKNSERTRRNSLCGATLDAVTPSRAPSRTPSTRSTSSQIVTTLRYRISNASLFLHKEESRAAKISVVVIVLFFICWLPYYSATLLHTSLLQVWVPGVVHSVVLVLALSNSALSPYLYLYRSRRIQREVRRLFGLPLSSTKSSIGGGGSSRRRQYLRHQLEIIPPSPTVPDANFEAGMNPYLVMCKGGGQRGSRASPLTAILNKLFRAKGFAWDPWRDSFTSTTSSSTTTTSSSTSSSSSNSSGSSTATGATDGSAATESESMLPRLALAKTDS